MFTIHITTQIIYHVRSKYSAGADSKPVGQHGTLPLSSQVLTVAAHIDYLRQLPEAVIGRSMIALNFQI
ncbi:MAG: hypothetical protein M3371_06400 [Acidobacteriota bacterium]|nr:hypothetical protein [Acidobacteriota bacterium]